MKILYVEDNEDNIYMLRSRLARAGFTVVVATDGAQGVAMAASEQPDLVLRPGTPEDLEEIAELFLATRRDAVPQMPPVVSDDEKIRAWFVGRR